MTELLSSRTDTDVLLRRLVDESDIRAVLARYARGIDRFDMDMVRSCYHEDATDAHGHYNGDIEGFIEYSLAWADKIEDGEGAKPMDRLANIRYVDLFERRDGAWRIAHRKVVHQPGRLDPVEIDPPLAEQAFRARIGPDDPSYDRRPESFLP